MKSLSSESTQNSCPIQESNCKSLPKNGEHAKEVTEDIVDVEAEPEMCHILEQLLCYLWGVVPN